MTIWERVEDALETLGAPFAQSQYISASPGQLPDLFLVYFLVSGVGAQDADNLETMRDYRVQVSIYNRTGLVGLPDVNGAMAAAGFVKGPERELPYNKETRHFGLAKDYFYIEEE